jgi:hypothetical protein
MSKAVRYDEFGGIDVLRVDEVERPVPGDGQVLVRVKAAGINPSEACRRRLNSADVDTLAEAGEALCTSRGRCRRMWHRLSSAGLRDRMGLDNSHRPGA